MASLRLTFTDQLRETRKKIQDSFKRSHEALQVRETSLLSRVQEIETEYEEKLKEINGLLESLNKLKSYNSDALTSNVLSEAREGVNTVIDGQVAKLKKELHYSLDFEWDSEWEIRIKLIGYIKLNSKSSTVNPFSQPVITSTLQSQFPNLFGAQTRPVSPLFKTQPQTHSLFATPNSNLESLKIASNKPRPDSNPGFTVLPKPGANFQFPLTSPATTEPFGGNLQFAHTSPTKAEPFQFGGNSQQKVPAAPQTNENRFRFRFK